MRAIVVLKRMRMRINYARNIKKWNREYLELIREEPADGAIQPYLRGRNCLFLVPHADDELFGGYMLTRKENVLLCYCGFTGENYQEKNRLTRQQEYQSYVDRVGAKSVFPYDLAEELPSILVENQIDTIVLPSLVDWHLEHRLVNYLTGVTCERANIQPQILWYMVSVPVMAKERYIVPMTESEQEEKYTIFREVYRSQRHLATHRFKLLERLAARGTEYFAAESYMKIEYEQWVKLTKEFSHLEGVPANEMLGQIKRLKSKLGSLKQIRQEAKAIYDILLQ